LPGLHRLDLGDVILTLAFGDGADLLAQLVLVADAIYLDGFAPDRNPDLWSEAVVAQLQRLSAAGTTLATWSTAGEIRRRLASADFILERKQGFGGKREMLIGHRPGTSPARQRSRRRVAVIGAGIAGAATAHALAKRGHEVIVIDAADAAASGASGNLAGVFRPLPALDDGRLARVLRAGFLLGRRSYSSLTGIRLGWTGVLHVARDATHEQTQQRIVEQHSLPADYCRFVTRNEASCLTGSPVAFGGWWFPLAGWINPPSLCQSLLDGIDCRYNFPVSGLHRQGHVWQILSGEDVIETDAAVIANGIGAPALVPDFSLPIRPGRGMVSHLPETATAAMNIVATRLGYVTPPIDGLRCAGATLQADDLDATPRLADHVENLFRLDMLLPDFARGIDPAQLDGRVSFRPMSPDRLPMVGPLAAGEGLWINNGYGARGLVFASICAELLASQVDDDPLPLEADLVRSLAPDRFKKRKSVPN
jgi:tRNA 5-methylaminomethyl-2-thiouridine biosynthesis bifunctional protein